MRNTKQRNLILSILNSNFHHPSAEEIYFICRKKICNISLGTVYRNLNLLVDQGLIKRIKMPDHIDRFDYIKTNHPHFICVKCNKIIDIEDNFTISNQKIGNNKVLDYELNFRGICEDCQRGE